MGKLINVIKMVADPTENESNIQNFMLSNYNTKLLLTVYFKTYIFYSTFMPYVPQWKHFTAYVMKLREQHYNKWKYRNKIQDHFRFWGALIHDINLE